MRLTALLFLAFCFGLSYWEFALRMRLRKVPYGLEYSSDLPRIFGTPVFQILKLLGSVGIILVPVLYWSKGLLGVGAALAVFFVLGAIIGIAIPAIIDRL
jgi:hypothetical protein